MSEKITYVCMTQNRLKNVQRNMKRVIDYVDAAVIVDGFSVDGTKDWLEAFSPKIKVVQRKWDDSFANQYNRYLQEISEGWIFICDDDELPSVELLKSLRTVVAESKNGTMYDIVEYKVHDIQIDNNDKIINDPGPKEYFRQLLHRYNPGMHYAIHLHQNLRGHKIRKALRRQEEYYHIKSIEDEVRNSCRNWWIAGVWNDDINEGVQPPEWHELRRLFLSAYPDIAIFSDVNSVMVKGNLDQSIKDYLLNVVPKLVDQPPARKFWELKQFTRYYFDILHPEEKPNFMTELEERLSKI